MPSTKPDCILNHKLRRRLHVLPPKSHIPLAAHDICMLFSINRLFCLTLVLLVLPGGLRS